MTSLYLGSFLLRSSFHVTHFATNVATSDFFVGVPAPMNLSVAAADECFRNIPSDDAEALPPLFATVKTYRYNSEYTCAGVITTRTLKSSYGFHPSTVHNASTRKRPTLQRHGHAVQELRHHHPIHDFYCHPQALRRTRLPTS
jgi:hypothetical protein